MINLSGAQSEIIIHFKEKKKKKKKKKDAF